MNEIEDILIKKGPMLYSELKRSIILSNNKE
jgi:hypothetical protein